MTKFGSEKASVIASVATVLKKALLPAVSEDDKEILATHVGHLIEQGYDLADIRYAACEIALAGDQLWSLDSRVRTEFSTSAARHKENIA